MNLVQSEIRVDKRSASAFLSWHGGCAALIHPTNYIPILNEQNYVGCACAPSSPNGAQAHPTYFAENKLSLHTYPTIQGCVPRTDDDGAWNAPYGATTPNPARRFPQ